MIVTINLKSGILLMNNEGYRYIVYFKGAQIKVGSTGLSPRMAINTVIDVSLRAIDNSSTKDCYETVH